LYTQTVHWAASEGIESRPIVACNELVIHMDENKHHDLILFVDVKTWICSSRSEAVRLHSLVEGLVGTAGRLT
jgi:hypothetical protein